jgi:hypothetical protein
MWIYLSQLILQLLIIVLEINNTFDPRLNIIKDILATNIAIYDLNVLEIHKIWIHFQKLYQTLFLVYLHSIFLQHGNLNFLHFSFYFDELLKRNIEERRHLTHLYKASLFFISLHFNITHGYRHQLCKLALCWAGLHNFYIECRNRNVIHLNLSFFYMSIRKSLPLDWFSSNCY